ncbi:MAG: acetyl-CoA C-acetyltransferase [Candidatus Hermodarchaeota archaeon]
MKKAVIVSAVRTAIGRYGSMLANFRSPELGAFAIQEAVKRAKLQASDIQEVIMGCVLTAGLGQAPARQAAIKAGIPVEVGALTINKVCGSGLKAVVLAAQAIKLDEAAFIVAGGMESMSNAPYLVPKARFGYRYGNGKLIDAMEFDGLWDIYNSFPMIETGNIIAERFKLTREEIDLYASRSYDLALASREKFKEEIVPIEVPQRKGDPILFDYDEGPRKSPPEALAKLRPAGKGPFVTAGNASQLSDGASALVVTSEEKAKEMGLPIMATIGEYVTSGTHPEWVMEAPIPGVRKLLEKTGFEIKDFDLIEHNEAFASASVAIQKEFSIPDDKFNVNGGAVALGHPIGCSGARILTTLLYEMKRRDSKRGLATICLGGGNAVSMIVER